jgi:hypothetical protein
MPPRSNNNGRDSRQLLGSQEQPRNVYQRLSNLEKNTLTNRGGARTAGSTPSRICPRLCVPVEIVAEGKERRAILEIWDDINAYSDPDNNFAFLRVLEADEASNTPPIMILRQGPFVVTNHAGNTKLSIYHDNTFSEYVVLDFTGIDPVNGFAYINGPTGGQLLWDKNGTQIYDTLVLSAYTGLTASRSILVTDQVTVLPFNCSSGALTCTLPDANTVLNGTAYLIGKIDTGTNTLTIAPHSGDTIVPSTALVLSTPGGMWVVKIAAHTWLAVSSGGTSTPRRFKLVWNYDGSTVTTDGAHWQLPCDCTVVGAFVKNKQDSPVTQTTRIRRASLSAYEGGTWDASFIDDGNLALNPGTFISLTSPSDFTDWTTSLLKDDVLRLETTTGDAAATDMILTLQLEEAP